MEDPHQIRVLRLPHIELAPNHDEFELKKPIEIFLNEKEEYEFNPATGKQDIKVLKLCNKIFFKFYKTLKFIIH